MKESEKKGREKRKNGRWKKKKGSRKGGKVGDRCKVKRKKDFKE